MKKMTVRKLLAFVLAMVMVLAMTTTAFADPATLNGGEVGGFSTPDTPVVQDKSVKIAKELTVYNADETKIYAPTVSYTYTITAGPEGTSITDETTDHASGTAVTVTTVAGITTGLKVNGTAGTTGTIAWVPTEQVDALSTGAPNLKYLTLDFSDVVFGATGVYRYTISEAITGSYTASGVTETNLDTNPHVRYLDVYVKPAETVTGGGNEAGDWDIYGYVCVINNETITPDGDTTTTGAIKTNGFVAGTKGETAYKADSYYTYNVKISKTVTNDAYAKATHAFPFTVIFTNSAVTQPVDINISSKTEGTVEGYTDPSSAALSLGTTKGIVTLKDSSWVKYIGIPCGTSVEVYETNDVTGATYKVTTTVDSGTNPNVENVTSGSAPSTAVAQGDTRADYQSTKTVITPTVDTNDTVSHVIAVDNNLQNISPTGVILRYAPYLLVLIGGILLLGFGWKLMRRSRKSEEA